MKRLSLAVVLAGIMLILNGCAVYVPPYADTYYGYAPYGGYGYQPYGYYRARPHFYGWGWRGHGRR